MKYFALLLVAALIGAGGVWLHAQHSPVVISDSDMLKLRLAQSQLDNIQLRYQTEANNVLKERDGLMAFYCSKAGLSYGPQGNCAVNDKGEVFRQTAQPPAAPKK